MPLQKFLNIFRKKRNIKSDTEGLRKPKKKWFKMSIPKRFKRRKDNSLLVTECGVSNFKYEHLLTGLQFQDDEEVVSRLKKENLELKNVLTQQTKIMAEQRKANQNLQEKLRELEKKNGAERFAAGYMESDDMEINTGFYFSDTDESTLREKFEEQLRKATMLEKELAEIRKASRNIYIHNCKGVAVGNINEITLKNEAEDNETITSVSNEVKNILDILASRMEETSSICQRTEKCLSEQTVLIENIDTTIKDLSLCAEGGDSKVTTELQNIRSLIQQARQRYASPNNSKRSSMAFSDTSLDSASKTGRGFVMWSLQDDQQKVVQKLELIPHMSEEIAELKSMIESLAPQLQQSNANIAS